MTRNYQFNNKQIGLTYPRADNLTKEIIENFFKSFVWKNNNDKDIIITNYIICKEHHAAVDNEDVGGIHFHCYVKFNDLYRERSNTSFDIDGNHPHVDKVRGVSNMITYLTKEDPEPLANFDFKSKQLTTKVPDIYDILNKPEIENPEQFQRYILKNFGDYSIKYWHNLVSISEFWFRPTIDEYVSPYTNFNPPSDATTWVNDNLSENIGNFSFINIP